MLGYLFFACIHDSNNSGLFQDIIITLSDTEIIYGVFHFNYTANYHVEVQHLQ